MRFPSRVTPSLLAPLLLCVPATLGAEEPTFVEVDGVVYGARADERGPIGGNDGYTATITSGDHVAKNLDELIEALAIAKRGETVFIPGDLEIDLTARIYIEKLMLDIPEGVTLASDRGHNGSAGALVTSDALETPIMIRAMGPDVRVTGLRIRGPNGKRYLDHHARAHSPEIRQRDSHRREYYYRFPTSDGIVTRHSRLEVDNCEISCFAHSGVYLMTGTDHHIHHCSIHHCQYQGLGYGVSHDEASSIVEYNLFDWNRHSIAGTGRPSCGYIARHNVECGVSLSHCFDMHGGRDRRDGTDIAGTSMEVHNNTFLAKQLPIKIRGVPEEKVDVHHNWFPHHATAHEAVVAHARTEVDDNWHGPAPVGLKE